MRLRRIMAIWRTNARMRLLGWATLFGVLSGLLGLLEPVDDFIQTVRNQLLPRAASGQIVVVGVDEKSITKLGRWPWARATSGELIDKLNESGVAGIYFDFVFLGATSETDRRSFEGAIARSRAPVVFAAVDDVDPVTARNTGGIVKSDLKGGSIGSIRTRINYAGQVRRLPLGVTDRNTFYPSMAVELSGKKVRSTGQFPIDTSVVPKSIPRMSAIDVLEARQALPNLRGKKVIIGPEAAILGDIKQYPAVGPLPGVYYHVVGAETLMRGFPLELGWLPALLIAFLAAWATISNGFKRGGRLLAVTTFALIFMPLAGEQYLIFTQIAPALALIGFVAARLLLMRARRAGSMTNSGSGLPNLEALRDRGAAPDNVIVALRIHNYPDIVSSLQADMQTELVEQIAGRVALGAGGSTLYQGDDGVFVWLKPRGDSAAVGDELEGLFAVLRQPVRVGGRSIDLLVTFGVERDGSRSLTNRIGSALLASDEARTNGEHWRDFDPGSLETADWRLSMLGQIDGAIDNGEIWVAFQPQLNLATGRIEGAEALIRWSHPVRGEIRPDEFILHAEATGRIDHLTGFVISRAAQAGLKMLAHGLDFRISVNLSAELLSNPYVVDIITPHIDATGFPRDRMTLEITETSEFRDDDKRAELIEKLLAAGFRLSIDDYGTGFSTLDYMRRIPAAEIKIDKSFVSRIVTSEADRDMVASTIDLAHKLGRRVVAEGVEDEATLVILRMMACDTAQGYLVGYPMPVAQLEPLVLNAEARRTAA